MLTKHKTLYRHARRRRVSLAAILTLGALLAACTGGSGTVTPTPGTSPTPGGSPINSPQPSPTPTERPTPGEGDISHPTGPTDVILRMEQGGGFVPMGFLATQAPEFTLYGDGTFIIQPLTDPELGDAWDGPRPRFLQGTLDEESIQELLGFALGPGRMLDARGQYRDDMVADASTTIFTINAGGISKSVSVYALSEVTEPRADAEDRAGFHQLSELLRSFEGMARGGDLGEVVLYEPTHYRATLLEAFGGEGEPSDWPWEHVSPDDFRPVEEFGAPVAILPAEDVAVLTDVPSGGHPGFNVDYEGTSWTVTLRPLLPDETPQG